MRPLGHHPPDELLRARLLRTLGPVLAGLTFPACRWEILAESDAWGASGVSRRLLVALPEGRYGDLDTILSMVEFACRRNGPAG